MAEQPWVRLVLAISLDGRLAPQHGGAAQLGGAGDRRALEEALAWGDAVLIGAGTLRAHRSSCLIRDTDLLLRRSHEVRPPQPAALVVTRNAEFPLEWPFFQQPFERHLLSEAGLPAPGFQGALRLAPCWRETLVQLASFGWSKLLLLGGARLCHSLLAEDAVDELQLTLCPRLLGGAFTWLPAQGTSLSPQLARTGAWTLVEARPIGDDELLVRYRRNRCSSS